MVKKYFFENASSPGTEKRRHSLFLLFGLFFFQPTYFDITKGIYSKRNQSITMSWGQFPFQGRSDCFLKTVLIKTWAVHVWGVQYWKGSTEFVVFLFQDVSYPPSTLFPFCNQALNEAVLVAATWLLWRIKILSMRQYYFPLHSVTLLWLIISF